MPSDVSITHISNNYHLTTYYNFSLVAVGLLRGREWMLPACKPGSVERELGRSFLWERGHPRPRAAYPQRLGRGGPPLAAYLALLPLGFAVPLMLPPARWALTPPFHPCLCAGEPGHRRFVLCCTFRRSNASPRRYLAACPVEPGLSSSALAPATIRPTASV